MKSDQYPKIFALVMLLFAAGCSESVAPPSGNGSIPRGALEGEYGFVLKGKTYDSGTNQGNASIRPVIIQGGDSLEISISLFFQYEDGSYGSVQILMPIHRAEPQTSGITSFTLPQNSNPTASVDYDSLGFTWFSSLPGGSITITKIDTVNNLVSGTFNFAAAQTSPTANPDNIVQVTSGYFNDIPIVFGAFGQGSVTDVVNGTNFSADTGGREMVYATPDQGRLSLYADGVGLRQGSEISIRGVPLATGTYTVSGPSSLIDTALSFTYWFPSNIEISTADSVSNGQITITKCDIPNRRISGTFQFTGFDIAGEHVTITSGVINNVRWEP